MGAIRDFLDSVGRTKTPYTGSPIPGPPPADTASTQSVSGAGTARPITSGSVLDTIRNVASNTAPTTTGAPTDDRAAFDESVRKYQLDRRAYEQYNTELNNRLRNFNPYADAQYRVASTTPPSGATYVSVPTAPAPTAPTQLRAPTYGAISQFSNLTPQQQGELYLQQRNIGYTDADIRKATAAQVGTPSEEMMAGIYKTAYPQYTQAIESQYGTQFNRTGYGTGAGQIDYPGYNYYINQLSTGAVTPETLESAIRGGAATTLTPVTTPGTTAPTSDINALYQQYFNRQADPGGLQYWQQSGLTGDALRDAVIAGAQGPDLDYYNSVYNRPFDPGHFAARGGYISKYAGGGRVRTHYQTGGQAGEGNVDELDAFYRDPRNFTRPTPRPLPTVRPISKVSANDPRLLDAAIAELSLNRRNVTPAMIEQVSEQYGVEPAKISERLNLPGALNVSPAPRPAAPAAPQNTASEGEPLAEWRRVYEDLPINSTEEWSRAYAELPANNPMEDFSRPPPNQTSAENFPAETATQPEPQSTGGGRSGFEDLVSRYMGSGGEYSRELAAARQRSQAETDAFSNLIKQMSERSESPASRAEMYFRLAAAFGSPTRTGQMGETLSKVGEQMGEYTKGRRADEAERRGLMLKAQEIKMAGAREELATTKALAAQESADRRSMAKELVKEYIASRRPQSDAGKLAEDAGYKRGTPEYNDYVQRYIRNKEENGDFYRRAMLELRMADERRKLEKETELSPTELKMKADQLGGLSAARMALEDVREALRRNQNSYGLSGTDYAAYRARALSGSADEKVLNTQMIENLLTRGAIDSLKEKFGAGITNEERRALVNLAGADAATRELRESILRRTERELELSLKNREKQLEEISSGAFRKMTPR